MTQVVTAFLSSVSCSSTSVDPKEGAVRTSVQSHLVRSTGDDLGLKLAPTRGLGAVLLDLKLRPGAGDDRGESQMPCWSRSLSLGNPADPVSGACGGWFVHWQKEHPRQARLSGAAPYLQSSALGPWGPWVSGEQSGECGLPCESLPR